VRLTTDRLTPSTAALAELTRPEILRACDVTGRTTIRDAAITYEVLVGEWIVWARAGEFGHEEAHRAGGAAFASLAREQERVMHEWADRILAVRGGKR